MPASFFSRLGPGLLYAGAAVGVSHLVQSTRAGANYGLAMIAVVIIANVIKYPFFKAGPLYAAVTGKSLLEAFNANGKWAMWLFYLVTIGTMFAVQAVVTLICSSVLAAIFNLTMPLWQISAFIILICFVILVVGQFDWLNKIMKAVIILLTLTTVVTLLAALAEPPAKMAEMPAFDFSNATDVLFLIALVGWMPAPLDISLWHSEWTIAELKAPGKASEVKKSVFDFNVGYWGTTFLAVAFVTLGSIILRGSGETLSSSGAVFSGQVIGMYTQTIGEWSFLFVAIAAFTTMFSTTLTVLDAFPRVLSKALQLSFGLAAAKVNRLYTWSLIILISGAMLVLIFLMDNMKQLVDLATSISFLTAPILATLILWVAYQNKKVFQQYTTISKVLALIGLIFLFAFSGYYLGLKL